MTMETDGGTRAGEIAAALSRIRIVLVGVQHPGNIGAAARAMLTMGLTDLRLVAPRQLPDEQSVAMASSAAHVLERARVHVDIAEAVADCTRVYATTARRRDLSVPFTSPRRFAEDVAARAVPGPIALLFGPERVGLTNQQLGYCHEAIEIPANPEFSSLNLAASVQVLSYELRQAALALRPAPAERHRPAPQAGMELFYEHLNRVLIRIGFMAADNPRRLPLRLRRLYSRAAPDDDELSILRGILTCVERKLDA